MPLYVLVPRDSVDGEGRSAPPVMQILEDMSKARQRRHVARAVAVPLGTALLTALAPSLTSFLALESAISDERPEVVHTVLEGGPTLVRVPLEIAREIENIPNGLDVVPVVGVRPAIVEPTVVSPRRPPSTGSASFRVRVRSAAGHPIAGAHVWAIFRPSADIGSEAITNSAGYASLDSYGYTRIRLLVARPTRTYWSKVLKNVTIHARRPVTVDLTPIRGHRDILRARYPLAPPRAGRGVKVAVVDTGIGPHHDLRIDGGRNVVLSEAPSDWWSNGNPHGTHVAGIIASRSTNPLRRGLAPGVTLYSVRIYPDGSDRADDGARPKLTRAARRN